MNAPNIEDVRPGPNGILIVTWKNGIEIPVDIGAFLKAFVIFAPLLHDPVAFGTVSVGEWGWNAHWSDDMEIATDTLWHLALKQGKA